MIYGSDTKVTKQGGSANSKISYKLTDISDTEYYTRSSQITFFFPKKIESSYQ